jgi:hypothetical protein
VRIKIKEVGVPVDLGFRQPAMFTLNRTFSEVLRASVLVFLLTCCLSRLILAGAAVNASKQWKFQPFQLDGKPSKAVIRIAFSFDL